MEEVVLSQKEEKKRFKKEINKLARTLIYYELGMVLAVFIIAIYLSAKYMTVDLDLKAYFAAMDASLGPASILGIAIGMIFILIYRKKEFLYDLKTVKSPMTFKSFILLLLVVMACRLLYTGAAISLEAIVNFFGYSFFSYFESLDSITDTPVLILYAVLIGPIAEEIVFRGAALRKLEGKGRIFAMVISSILFGVFHGNLPQGIYAFFVGMALAYITLEYSIIWAMVLHIINNGISVLLEVYNVSELLSYSMDITFFIAGAVVLIMNRKKIKNYLVENKTEKRRYSVAFSSFWLMLLIAVNLILSVIYIEKII